MNFLVSQASSSPRPSFCTWALNLTARSGSRLGRLQQLFYLLSRSTSCSASLRYIVLKIGFIILLPRMTVSFSIDLIVDEWEVWETVVAQLERPALPATEAEGHGQESRQFSCTHSCHKVHSPISWVCKESPIKLLSTSSSNWMDKNGFA